MDANTSPSHAANMGEGNISPASPRDPSLDLINKPMDGADSMIPSLGSPPRSIAVDTCETETAMDADDPTKYGTTPLRFAVLLIFSFYGFINQVQYVGFATIIKETENRYDVVSIEVNLLALLVPFVYCVGVIPGCWVYNHIGLRHGMITGAAFTAFAAVLKFISVWATKYPLLVIAQLCVAIGQILFLSLPPLVAGRWFPARERTVATSVGSLFCFFGMAVGMFYAPRVVHFPGRNGTKQWGALLGSQLGLSTVVLALMILLVPESPSKPPSATAAHQGRDSEMWSKLFRQFRNKNLVLLALSFGLQAGALTAVAAVLTQIVEPFDISETRAGILAFAGIMAGAVNCVIVGAIVDHLRRYKAALLFLSGVTTGLILIVVIVTRTIKSDHSFSIAAYVLVPLLEFLVLPMVPIVMELSVELTYPAPVAASSTLMLLSMCFFSFLMMIIFSVILGNHPSKNQSFAVLVTVFGCCFFSTFGLCLVKEHRHRHNIEKSFAANADSARSLAESGV